MKKTQLKQSNRYINDLHRMNYQQGQVKNARSGLLPFVIAAIFLIIAGIYGSLSLDVASENIVMLVAAAIIGGYMALNIGANDVANAVGPLAAIVSTFSDAPADAKISIPIWVMMIGAIGLALGLLLFGPKLINTVGQKITRLNAPRAYSVALASAITVLIATSFGLPVSSTHIAIGAIFGVGFLREYLEYPNKKRMKPGHMLNHTAEDAFDNISVRMKRKLVRRRFVYSIAAAWIITVPASALLSATLFYVLMFLAPTG